MATVHPADGLIKRLLEQNSNPSQAASHDAAMPEREVQKPVRSSSGGCAQEAATPAVRSHVGERQLESQLLQLYRSNARRER